MIEFFLQHWQALLLKTWEHLYISALSLIAGIAVAVPAGILLARSKRLSGLFMGLASAFQTIPSLALLAVMIPLLGVGKPPAVAALFAYSLLPILRNTCLGIKGVDPGVVDAARGMGMTRGQVLLWVRLPLAAPVIMAGSRVSGTYLVSWATIASYVGAGGLGDFIFMGLNNYIPPMIVLGTLPVTALALLTDLALGRVERALSPRLRSVPEGGERR